MALLAMFDDISLSLGGGRGEDTYSMSSVILRLICWTLGALILGERRL